MVFAEASSESPQVVPDCVSVQDLALGRVCAGLNRVTDTPEALAMHPVGEQLQVAAEPGHRADANVFGGPLTATRFHRLRVVERGQEDGAELAAE